MPRRPKTPFVKRFALRFITLRKNISHNVRILSLIIDSQYARDDITQTSLDLLERFFAPWTAVMQNKIEKAISAHGSEDFGKNDRVKWSKFDTQIQQLVDFLWNYIKTVSHKFGTYYPMCEQYVTANLVKTSFAGVYDSQSQGIKLIWNTSLLSSSFFKIEAVYANLPVLRDLCSAVNSITIANNACEDMFGDLQPDTDYTPQNTVERFVWALEDLNTRAHVRLTQVQNACPQRRTSAAVMNPLPPRPSPTPVQPRCSIHPQNFTFPHLAPLQNTPALHSNRLQLPLGTMPRGCTKPPPVWGGITPMKSNTLGGVSIGMPRLPPPPKKHETGLEFGYTTPLRTDSSAPSLPPLSVTDLLPPSFGEPGWPGRLIKQEVTVKCEKTEPADGVPPRLFEM